MALLQWMLFLFCVSPPVSMWDNKSSPSCRRQSKNARWLHSFCCLCWSVNIFGTQFVISEHFCDNYIGTGTSNMWQFVSHRLFRIFWFSWSNQLVLIVSRQLFRSFRFIPSKISPHLKFSLPLCCSLCKFARTFLERCYHCLNFLPLIIIDPYT